MYTAAGTVLVKEASPRLAFDKCPVTPTPVSNSKRLEAWLIGARGRDLPFLLALGLLVLCLRIWLLLHTEVAARDSIGFIRYALELERLPIQQVFEQSQQHPGYPTLLLVVSWPVRFLAGGTSPVAMQYSAQMASSLASLVLALLTYYLGKELYGRTAGFWGALLFQCLPVSCRALTDGLSEATYLMFMAAAMLMACRGFQTRSPGRFALCGIFGALAYLTRPEGVLIILAAVLALLGMQVRPVLRWPVRRVVLALLSLTMTASAVAAPYVLITGKLTNKTSGKAILGDASALVNPGSGAQRGHPSANESAPQSLDHSGSPRMIFAVFAPPDLQGRFWWGLWGIGMETAKACGYFAGIPILIGLWWFRGLLRAIPGAWVILLLCLLHVIVLWRLTVAVGYVSDRHVLLLSLSGVCTGTAMVLKFGHWLAELLARRLKPSEKVRGWRPWLAWLPTILVCCYACFSLPDSLRTLHANRSGHRAAGLWLADRAKPYDPILDPFCWAHFYAGRVIQETSVPEPPPGVSATFYVVLEGTKEEHYRLTWMEAAEKLAAMGKVVYHWPEHKPVSSAKVRVFAVPLPPRNS